MKNLKLPEWANSIVEMTENIISDLQERSIEVISSQQQKENRLKTNRFSGACRTLTKEPTFILLNPRGRENGTEKILKEIMAEISKIWGKDINLRVQGTK